MIGMSSLSNELDYATGSVIIDLRSANNQLILYNLSKQHERH